MGRSPDQHGTSRSSVRATAPGPSTSRVGLAPSPHAPSEISSTAVALTANNCSMQRAWKFMAAATFIGTAWIGATLAGPEPIAESSKDKNVVEQKVEQECNWYVSIGGGADFDFDSTQFN